MVRAGEWVGMGLHHDARRARDGKATRNLREWAESAVQVARRARGFDMEVHYNNRTRLPPELEGDAIWHDTVESLLAASDFLSI